MYSLLVLLLDLFVLFNQNGGQVFFGLWLSLKTAKILKSKCTWYFFCHIHIKIHLPHHFDSILWFHFHLSMKMLFYTIPLSCWWPFFLSAFFWEQVSIWVVWWPLNHKATLCLSLAIRWSQRSVTESLLPLTGIVF